MIIHAISDLHGFYPYIGEGDVLILAGDLTRSDSIKDWCTFFWWLKKQDYSRKIIVAGNHDNFFMNGFPKNQREADLLKEVHQFLEENGEEKVDFEYLCDSETVLTEGNKLFKVWGTPWTPWFNGVHPSCKAFMLSESKLQKKFEKIPDDIDILITHTPPYMVLDENKEGRLCGSLQLRYQLDTRCHPAIHIFGHIHENGGKCVRYGKTDYFNVSYVDENYQPICAIRKIEI